MTEGSRPLLATLADVARRAGSRRVAAAVVTALVSGVTAVLASLWLKFVVDGATHRSAGEATAAAAALGATLALQYASALVAFSYQSDLQLACGGLLVRDVMLAATRVVGIEHYERPEFADRIALLKREMGYLSGFVPLLGQATGLIGRVVVTAVLLAGVHPVLLLLPVLALPSIWAGARAEAVVNRANEATAAAARQEEHLFGLSTTSSPAKELRIFGLGAEIVDRQRRSWDAVTDAVTRAQLRAGLLRTLGWLPFAAGYLGAVGLALALAGRGRATPGDVLMVMLLASQVSGQVAQMLNLANRSATGSRVLRRYRWLMDYSTSALERLAALDPAPVPERLEQGIDLVDVGFSYGGAEGDQVLRDITLHLAPGSTVALVGENGAGKTTLVKLLCRFYEPTCGRITVDAVDLDRFDAAEWRGRLSGGFQDFVRYELVLRQSVGVGDVPGVDDEERVEAALAQVGADLPLALGAQLGRQWPGGVDLSEGQWQRVAMARAMMRDRPLLMLLDEPTSGLDPHAEHRLFEMFADVASTIARENGAIALFVSHRFSTVRMADHIVVLDRGRVVEQGSHGELVAAGGLYAELYGLQARAYT